MDATNHALYRTGRLGESLFALPQATFSYDPLIMLQSMSVHSFVNWFAVLDMAMDLGTVNTAEKIAGELMENMGPYPDIIYRRALVQIAKGNTEATAVYLNKLAGMPFHRSEAKRLLGMIDRNDAFTGEPRITAMRVNSDTVDYFLDNNPGCDVLLDYLLKSNPGNRASFEYLMTNHLLTGRIEDAAALVQSAPSLGYSTLPHYWDEALCLFQAMKLWQSGSSELSFSGLPQETVERVKRFYKAWIPLENDPAAARKLVPEFGVSYFFFSSSATASEHFMNNRRRIIFLWCTVLLFECSTDLVTIQRNCRAVGRPPVIEPDYTGITIPPNIAPMRFTVRVTPYKNC